MMEDAWWNRKLSGLISSGQSLMIVNNMTDLIPQARGVKQGCSLRPLIFNITIEGLLHGIMSCPVEGYSFGKGFEVKSLEVKAQLKNLPGNSLLQDQRNIMTIERYKETYQSNP